MTRNDRRCRHDLASRTVPLSLAFATILLIVAGRPGQAGVLDPALHYLGTPGDPEWTDLAAGTPEGRGLTVRFRGEANPRESTLLVRQRDVRLAWDVRLNGRLLGRLSTAEADLIHTLPVPPGAVRDGDNVLEIGPPSGKGRDDAVVGEVTLDTRPGREAIRRARLGVRISDAGSGRDLPSRITVADPRGVLVPLDADPDPRLALRPGTAYTASGRVRLGLRPGRYTVYATRGFEYSRAVRSVTLAEGQDAELDLELRREVPTEGLVACDTHIHTFTHSGHGDATVEERMTTLAGEGIELPIATDHNHLTDYEATARQLGLRGEFTPVIGDEVTTRKGHFNAFPFGRGERVPDARIDHWPDLMREIRAGSAGRIVVLNHPRDVHAGFRPFGPENFNAAVGDDRNGVPYGFDAVEVVNSGALQSDPMRVVRDWLALWNHGQEVTAVGSSDSHDVARYIVGQARTYIACRDDDPGRLDVEEACRNLRAGRALVSFGLLARLSVAGRFGPGDLATDLGETVHVSVTVLGPSWVSADRVELFANGTKIREQRLEPAAGTVEKGRVEWVLPRPRYDVALVAVASGPGVPTPDWFMPRPYQPTSRTWHPRVLALTNPVRLDTDGNHAWNSPRYYAQFLMEIFGSEPTTLFPMLAGYDEAVATQTAAFCLPAARGGRDPGFRQALKSAPDVVRRGFEAFEAASSP